MNSNGIFMAHLAARALLLALCPTARALAADGTPRWEQLLTEVLERAEQEQSTPAPPPLRAPAPPSGPQALRPIVHSYVRHFQGPGAKHYRASLSRLKAYRPMIQRVFREEGLPAELMWIGLVESGYNPGAKSPRNALGIWQLIPGTAKTFGLNLDQRDERADPEKSTYAAARYLRFLYARFGDWALTLAAYNAGETRVQNAIEKAQDRDFWRLSNSGLLPRETQAYVPAVLAAQFLGEGRVVEEGPIANDNATTRAARVELAPFSLSQ